MVLEKQDSGVCLSTEPGSPTKDDDPVSFRWSRAMRSRQRGKLQSGSVDGLESPQMADRKMELEGRVEETSVEGEEEVGLSMGMRGKRLTDTVPDLTERRKEGIEHGRQDEGWGRMENGGRATAGVRCHHHLLLQSENQENEDEPRICQICRKKEERLRALRRAIGDDHLDREDSTVSAWSTTPSAGLTRITKPHDTRSPSVDSPSSAVGSDHSSFDQLSSSSSGPSVATSKLTPKEGNRSNGQQRLALPAARHSPAIHSPAGGQSVAGHSGQTSPRNSTSGQQQQALMQKLQGALAKMTPKMFKSTKTERPPFSAQDQKILALMLAKKEAEERQRNLRELAHKQWEEEMMKTTKEAPNLMNSRASSMRRRRYTGDAALSSNKDKRSGERNSEDGAGSDPQTPCSAHGTSRPFSLTEDRDGGRGPENLDKGRRPAKSCPDKLQQQKSREKQIQAMDRKKTVEQRLEQQRREMEEHQLQLKRKQEEDLERANSMRMSKGQQQILRAKLKNLEAQQKQERISQMKRQSMVDLSQKHEAIQSRLSKAELKVQQLRQEEARRKREDLEHKIEQSRLRQEQIEAEQRQWQEELLKYQKWKDYQADGLTRENANKKKEAAYAQRIQREKLQRENMKRLLNHEEQWLNDVEATIAMKDARIRTVQKEKEEQIQRSRAMASASQRMREELKTHFSMNDLDQVTRQVVLENRLVYKAPQNGSRHLSPPSHNASSLTLGDGEAV